MTDEKPADSQPLPPPTLSTLANVLGTQALMALGLIRDPSQPELPVNREQAEHFIELVAMLDQKTAGNRTTEESQLLEEMLHQLRMVFVQTKS